MRESQLAVHERTMARQDSGLKYSALLQSSKPTVLPAAKFHAIHNWRRAVALSRGAVLADDATTLVTEDTAEPRVRRSVTIAAAPASEDSVDSGRASQGSDDAVSVVKSPVDDSRRPVPARRKPLLSQGSSTSVKSPCECPDSGADAVSDSQDTTPAAVAPTKSRGPPTWIPRTPRKDLPCFHARSATTGSKVLLPARRPTTAAAPRQTTTTTPKQLPPCMPRPWSRCGDGVVFEAPGARYEARRKRAQRQLDKQLHQHAQAAIRRRTGHAYNLEAAIHRYRGLREAEQQDNETLRGGRTPSPVGGRDSPTNDVILPKRPSAVSFAT